MLHGAVRISARRRVYKALMRRLEASNFANCIQEIHLTLITWRIYIQLFAPSQSSFYLYFLVSYFSLFCVVTSLDLMDHWDNPCDSHRQCKIKILYVSKWDTTTECYNVTQRITAHVDNGLLTRNDNCVSFLLTLPVYAANGSRWSPTRPAPSSDHVSHFRPKMFHVQCSAVAPWWSMDGEPQYFNVMNQIILIVAIT